MSIALKEARETRYWLTLIIEAQLMTVSEVSSVLEETEQLIKIIYTIIKKTKQK